MSLEDLAEFSTEKEFTHCNLCENNCMLTVSIFSDGRQFITGNRCEKGARIKIDRKDRKVNLVDYKYKRLFKYRSLKEKDASRGIVGIPRVLKYVRKITPCGIPSLRISAPGATISTTNKISTKKAWIRFLVILLPAIRQKSPTGISSL